jgi:hypothetical protein
MWSVADKADFKEEIDAHRAPRGQFQIVDVPELQYRMGLAMVFIGYNGFAR